VHKIPTVVISQTKARRQPLIDLLAKFSEFDTHIQPGIDGREFIGNEEYVDLRAFRFLNRREMLPGEAGCTLAHYSVYKKILENKWSWTLVFEDDSRVLPEEIVKIPELIKAIDACSDLYDQPILVHLNLDEARIVGRRMALDDHKVILETYTVLRLANAYLINFKAAEIAVREGLPVEDVPDWPHWIAKLRFLVHLNDVVFVDRNLGSEIGLRADIAVRQSNFRLIMKKITTLWFFVTGIEARRYRKNTRLNDYMTWIVLDRIFRFMGNHYGKSDLERKNVVLLESPLIDFVRNINKKKNASRFK